MDKIEERRRKQREYYAKNREKICEQKAAYRANSEVQQAYVKEYSKEYRKRNQEKIIEYAKTDANKKSKRICKWKLAGVKHPDFNELHDIWKAATNCADCDVILVESGITGVNRKCLDHDHITGLFRGIVCHACNGRRYQVDKKSPDYITQLSALNL